MRDPFAPKKKRSVTKWLMSFDSWVDDAMYRFKSGGGETWESLTIFFRRFRVYGLKKAGVELACERPHIGCCRRRTDVGTGQAGL